MVLPSESVTTRLTSTFGLRDGNATDTVTVLVKGTKLNESTSVGVVITPVSATFNAKGVAAIDASP